MATTVKRTTNSVVEGKEDVRIGVPRYFTHAGTEPFDRGKLMAGLTRACVKRPVPLADIEQAAVRIEADLRNGVGDEVEARRIGEQALRVLRDLDRVAYVRFASVYRDFQDVDEFERELAQLEGRKKPAKRVAKRTGVR